jgi:hypothetical protein
MMNVDCMEMRRRIEESIGFALEPDERDGIERHCAVCEECRAYREQLIEDDSRLAEFAAPCDESIGRVRERAIERVRAAELAPGRRAGRIVARIPRIATIAAAAAAVAIAFLAIDLIRGGHDGPVPAFAAVQEKMQKADNVVYRVRLWNLGEWTTYTDGRALSRISRRDFEDSTVVKDLRSRLGNTELRLYPGERRAVITREVYNDTCSSCDAKGRKRPDGLSALTGWYKQKGFSFVRKERYDGGNMAVYERGPNSNSKQTHRERHPNPNNKQTNRVTAWVDLETELLARLEVVSPRRGPNDAYPYSLRLNDFLPSGSKAAGWIELKPDEPCMILDNFRWNAISDTSYFSTVPPAGYSVEIAKAADPDEPSGYHHARGIARALSNWLDLSGNVFPDDIHDLMDTTKVKPLVLVKFRRGVDPVEEFRAAYRYADLLSEDNTAIWLLERMLNTPIHYAGKGAVLGDSKRAICWIKEEGEPYHVIYADLHVAASPTPPNLAGE